MGRRIAVSDLALGLAWLFVFVAISVQVGGVASAQTCNQVQHNVMGIDQSQTGRGNRANIWVNNINFGGLHGNVFRSLFVIKGTGPLDVEVGWYSTGGNPVSYFEFVTSNGVDSGARPGPSVSINAYPNFKVTAPGAQLPGGNWTWTAYLNSVAFDSIGLPFHIGKLRTNSERKNDCDTMWAEFRQLDNCSSVTGGSCNWHGSYVNLQCFKTVSGGQYRFNKIDNTRLTVPQTGGVTC